MPEENSFGDFQGADPAPVNSDDDLLGDLKLKPSLSSRRTPSSEVPFHADIQTQFPHGQGRVPSFPRTPSDTLRSGSSPQPNDNMKDNLPPNQNSDEAPAGSPKLHPINTGSISRSTSLSTPRTPSHIRLLGGKPGAPRILDEDLADALRHHLPRRTKISSRWSLLYSLDQDGAALTTLYDRCHSLGDKASVVLIIKTTMNELLGAYLNEKPRESPSYYGDGDCFLWKATPYEPPDVRLGYQVTPYRWTGKNNYVILSNKSFLSVGGGDGKYGLWVDDSFDHAITCSCPCFDNEPLVRDAAASNWVKFRILSFEAWVILQ